MGFQRDLTVHELLVAAKLKTPSNAGNYEIQRMDSIDIIYYFYFSTNCIANKSTRSSTSNEGFASKKHTEAASSASFWTT